MKHNIDELLDIVYRYYPRGVGITEDGDIDDQLCIGTEEHDRLVRARIQASKSDRWRSLRRRIRDGFPGRFMDHSLHLPAGGCDACYSFSIDMPESTGRTLWFHVSFLVPYYIVHSSRTVDIVKQTRDLFVVTFRGTRFVVSLSPFDPRFVARPDDRQRFTVVRREYAAFELLPEEQPCATWISGDIEATFGCERMPPEIGTVLVPDVLAGLRLPGEVRLYDCLFTDHHRWVEPSPSDEPAPGVEVEASNLTEPLVAVLTVLGALYDLLWTLMPELQSGACYCVVRTDGVLHKEEMVKALAKIRVLLEPPKTARGIAAKRELEAATRELEALVASWDGEGAPPSAMVAWASRFLESCLVDADP
ncbi:hypothetical protein BE04_27955 [Sorangium cellulosum]|uniref:Uncharacterized protein n=3 Tax=Sorangium cellulosum TaxID=56 RepID=A0A150NYK0_SORCE|nr:hypothetical protein [Sorangium cellulosum]AGP40187.1 hypothetical protein SCE1572_40200 [Sorangium cellulosum So0157-2]KYF46960.1 hypothetical protein BE04_27955 [Sorangium cellulosum]